MTSRQDLHFMLGLTALAFVLWVITFSVQLGNFWIKISFSAAFLALISLAIQRDILEEIDFNLRALLLGLVTAAALYGIFALGRIVSLRILWFAGTQIGEIYQKGAGTSPWVISPLLFFVTGPGEEIFWRGFLQRGMQKRFGGWTGYIIATALYASVHIPSMNFMLVGASAVAGAFWGLIYRRTKNLAAVIVSHSTWSTFIFMVMPLE